MKKVIKTATALMLPVLISLSGCVKDHDIDQRKVFKVVIENVSTPNLLPTNRAMGTVPLSPGVYAIYDGADPMFMLNQPANLGTEHIAEDGATDVLAAAMLANSAVYSSGVFKSAAASGPPIFAGESIEFMVNAKPSDKLQIETMFVQSNDWFISFKNGGLALFAGNSPISGDMTGQLEIYDAGTEADTAPGTGPDQKPVQMPASTIVGPQDSEPNIKVARDRHTGFNVPATASVIKVTVTPQ
ncbi:spondin domain-containing protein [Persicitalea sp.]|uniref:spondin domain-containing protein n=1 Tax=Persicitalea sp. TaxID=3100273 RepID=UPI003594046C